MKIGIIGIGHIGGNIARLASRSGHEVLLSFSRDLERLKALANELGDQASVVSAAEAVAKADLTVLSVPWGAIETALDQAGPLEGRIVIDTTNQFGSGPMPPTGTTAASFNAARMSGARYTKSFNTLTAQFQAETAGRTGREQVVQWICGDDEDAKKTVASFVKSLGYVPVDLGANADCAVMEAPRRPGAVYGEEYRLAEAETVVAAVRANVPIPPPPVYY